MSPSTDPFRLDGRVALVTGGGTGLGFGIARSLADAGARVVLSGRREVPLATAVQEIGDDRSDFIVHDVNRFDDSNSLISSLEAKHGPLDILVNNAGIHLKKDALDTRVEEFQRVLDTHLLGGFALAQAAASVMKGRGGGSILFIASMASLFGIPKVIAYTAAKTALVGLVRGLAVEISPYGVRVNALAPGWIDSPMSRKALDGDPDRKRRILERTPMNRLGAAEEVGAAAVFLSSPAAGFITGAILPVDGGVSIGF